MLRILARFDACATDVLPGVRRAVRAMRTIEGLLAVEAWREEGSGDDALLVALALDGERAASRVLASAAWREVVRAAAGEAAITVYRCETLQMGEGGGAKGTTDVEVGRAEAEEPGYDEAIPASLEFPSVGRRPVGIDAADARALDDPDAGFDYDGPPEAIDAAQFAEGRLVERDKRWMDWRERMGGEG